MLRSRYSNHVRGLVAFDDSLVGLAARATSWLGLQNGPRVQHVRNCLRKDKMREVLSGDPMLAVPYKCVTSEDELNDAIQAIGLPCITKPLDSNNSKYVQFCDTEDKAIAAGKRILDWSRETSGQAQVLIEPYFEGPEFSVESYTLNGETEIMAVCEKILGPLPYFIEIGHYLPTRQSRVVEDVISATAQRALRLLQIDNLVTHTELRLTSSGIKIIEINPRPAGGRLRDFVHSVTGYDLHEAAIQTALGRKPHRDPPAAACGIYLCPTAETEGIAVYDDSYLRRPLATGFYPVVELTVYPGEPVYPINHKEGKTLGRILAYGSDFEAVQDEIRRIFWELKFQVIPSRPTRKVAIPAEEATPLNQNATPADPYDSQFNRSYKNISVGGPWNWLVSCPPEIFQFASPSFRAIPVWSPYVGWTWLYAHPSVPAETSSARPVSSSAGPGKCEGGACETGPAQPNLDKSVIPDKAGAWDSGCC